MRGFGLSIAHPAMPNTKGENLCGPEWNGEPLPRFNKFSEDGGGGSSWPIWDGTLGTFCNQTVANKDFRNSLRGGGEYGTSNQPTKKIPWKTAIENHWPMYREPKRKRRGLAGDELGPAIMS